MSLQRKFAVLLAMIGLAVLANVAIALWTIELLESLARPWAEIQQVQSGLNALKHAATDQARLWSPGFPMDRGAAPVSGPEARDVFERDAAVIERNMASLEGIGAFRVRVGASTGANLRQRVEEAQALGRDWLAAPDDAATNAAARSAYDLHELIEMIEARLISHGYFEADFGRTIRPRLLLLLGASLAGAALACLLGAVLIRRWVVRPVRALRDAAVHLGRGDFSHRVPVQAKDEIGMLSAEVNHMAGLISAMQDERVDRERLAAVGEMVRRLAHNLRNPLAGIRSLAELTRAELPSGSATIENQDRIVRTVDRFERWLAELLGATTPLSISPEVCEVGPWLRAVAEPLEPLARERGVEIAIDAREAPPAAAFDSRHLEQAVVALVTNAIQASPRGARVDLRARRSPEAGAWELRCEDGGPGVPAELRERVFRAYFTTKRDGTGIGLAVAKQVVEQHGGRIWVEPASTGESAAKCGPEGGGGAAFVIWLPLALEGRNKEQVAKPGHIGVDGGSDSDRRGRGEPPVFDPANAASGRARGG
jgi:signal transduction histidine kinase